MRLRPVVAAVALLSAAAVPAQAADGCEVSGYNNGDLGVVSLSCGASLLAGCAFSQVNRPSSNDALLVVEGHMVVLPAGNGVRAVSADFRCVVRNAYTGANTVDEETSGGSMLLSLWAPPKVYAATSSTYVVCVAATVHWSDNTVTTTGPLACITPS